MLLHARLLLPSICAIACLTIGCAECPHYDKPVIKTASGTRLCAAHHVPLITVAGFQMCGDWPIIDPAKDRQDMENCNPNCISAYESLRKDATFCRPYQVTYCSVCEKNMLAWLKQRGLQEH
jgi:hypothetical protein